LGRFIPRMVVDHCHENAPDVHSGVRPKTKYFPAAVLFADISGFSKLTNKINAKLMVKANQKLKGRMTFQHKSGAGNMLQRDSRSSESLLKMLNEYFTPLIQIICQHGGDVIKFAGDALLVLWPADSPEKTLTSQVLACATCAWSIQASMRSVTTSEGIVLRTKLTVAAGQKMMGVYVGGVENPANNFPRWEFFTAGDAMIQVEICEKEKAANPGEVTITPQAWGLIKNHCNGRMTTAGHVILTDMGKSLEGDRLLSSSSPTPSEGSTSGAVEYLSTFVPEILRSRIVGRGVDMASLNAAMDETSEIRTLSVIFMSIDGLDFDHDAGTVDRVQEVVSSIQKALYKQQGVMRQFLVEDKGCTFIGAFGVPPHTFSNDAERAVLCSMDVLEALARIPGVTTSIGVATGRALCGVVGSKQRCEFTLAGDVVVLSARLMKSSTDSCLCDLETFKKCPSIAFTNVDDIWIKGKDEYITAYKPVGQRDFIFEGEDAGVSSADVASSMLDKPLVGRDTELKSLEECIMDIRPFDHGGGFVIQGNIGLGKTRLIQELQIKSQEIEDVIFLAGNTSAVDMNSPFRAMRPVFIRLLMPHASPHPKLWGQSEWDYIVQSLQNLDKVEGRQTENRAKWQAAEQQTSFMNAIHRSKKFGKKTADVSTRGGQALRTGNMVPQSVLSTLLTSKRKQVMRSKMVDMAPLLASVFGIEWKDNEHTSSLHGDERTMRTLKLLERVIWTMALKKKMVLFIDDAHWMDTYSVQLLKSMLGMDGFLAILSISNEAMERSKTLEQPSLIEILQSQSTVMFLELETLEDEDILTLVCGELNIKAAKIPPELRKVIVDKIQGNPMVAEEFSRTLKDRLSTQDGGIQSLSSMRPTQLTEMLGSVPDSIQAMIHSRINLLAPEAQTLLKVASVVGRIFSMRMVSRIYPADIDMNDIDIQELEEKLLIKRVSEDGASESDDGSVLGHEDVLNMSFEFCTEHTMDVVYSLMTYDMKRKLHVAQAAVLELQHGGLNNEASLANQESLDRLSHHWAEGEEYRKAIMYLEQAGSLAQQRRAYQQSLDCFNRIIDISITQDVDITEDQEAGWMFALCMAYKGLGRRAEAIDVLEQALRIHNPVIDKLMTSRWFFLKGVIELGLVGNWFAGGTMLSLCCSASKSRVNPDGEEHASADELSAVENLKVLLMLFELNYYENNMSKAMRLGFMAVFQAKRIRDPIAVAVANSSLSLVLAHNYASRFDTRKVSQMYKDLARKTIDSVPCTALSLDAMQVSMNLALRELVLGDIQSSQAMLEEAIQIGELYGNIQGVDQARLLLAVVLYMRGDFKAGAALCDTVIASGEEVGDMKTVAWGILSMVRVFLKVGQIQAAMQWLESHQEMLGKSLEGSDNFNDVTFLCILSNAKYKCGDLGSSFDIIIAVLKELSPGSKSRYEPLHLQSFAIADALLLLETVTLIFYTVHKDFEVDSNLPGLSRHTSCASEQAGRAGTTRQNSAGSEIRDMARDPQCDVVHGVSVAELHSTMRHTLSVFKLWSTAFPVIKPRLLFFQGVRALARNKYVEAFKCWDDGIEEAHRQGCRFLAAHIALESAQLLSQGSTRWEDYLHQAVLWFSDEVDKTFKTAAISLLDNGHASIDDDTLSKSKEDVPAFNYGVRITS